MPKKEPEENDESELEEEIEKAEDENEENVEDFDRQRFSNFMENWSMENVNPSLETTNAPQQVNLEQIEELDAGQTQTQNPPEEQREVTYETGYTADDYRNIEEMHWKTNKDFVVRQPTPINPGETELNFAPRQRNIQINPELQEMRQQQTGQLERDYVAHAKRIESDEHLPFENQKKYRPKI